jgi:hypothetical protein
MGLHLRICESCARLDTRIRRSLLLARNLPTIQPSAAFSERLKMRLAHERMLSSRSTHDIAMKRHFGPLSTGTYVALAAGVAMAAGLMVTVSLTSDAQEAIRLAPVVASVPEPEPSLLATPAMVASMPAGMPIWSAVFIAQQAPWHFASDAVVGR